MHYQCPDVRIRLLLHALSWCLRAWLCQNRRNYRLLHPSTLMYTEAFCSCSNMKLWGHRLCSTCSRYGVSHCCRSCSCSTRVGDPNSGYWAPWSGARDGLDDSGCSCRFCRKKQWHRCGSSWNDFSGGSCSTQWTSKCRSRGGSWSTSTSH